MASHNLLSKKKYNQKVLINENEYRKMHEAETSLWWYKILHEKVFSVIAKSSQSTDIQILDAGCGTGGMLSFLQKKGHKNIKGFDYSPEAVAFCQTKNLNVIYADITNLVEKFEEKYDIIICNDVLYQFDNEAIAKILFNLFSRLKPTGLLITNNQAFDIFSGIHDIAVGAKQRFTISKFNKILSKNSSNFQIKQNFYWSFFLTPLILSIRIYQKIKIKLGLVDLQNVESDVEIPSDFINNFLYKIVKLEEKLLKKPPFGSSLFLVFEKSF
jgi:SAM-dependent methyltransferase